MLSMQMEKESMQNRKPMILVLAGPNGSGESTITTFFDKVGKYTNADYIAGMTDQYALAKYSEYFMPKSWQVY